MYTTLLVLDRIYDMGEGKLIQYVKTAAEHGIISVRSSTCCDRHRDEAGASISGVEVLNQSTYGVPESYIHLGAAGKYKRDLCEYIARQTLTIAAHISLLSSKIPR